MAGTLRRLVRFAGAAVAVSTIGLSFVPSAVAADNGDPQTQIVGGTRASISQYPWTVFLTNTSGFQFCGGTLVSKTKVVTAAHCVKGTAASAVRVVSGREDKQSTAGTVTNVSKVWVHPSYTTATAGYDVAVLTLANAVNSAVLPLATPQDTALYAAGTNSTVLGWGTTSSGGSASRYLLKVDVPVTSDATCKTAYPQYSNTSMVCAGIPAGGKDSCQGDSGGPMVAGGKLIGVVSWGRGCALPNYPGVYARVAPYHAVLTAQINS
ncbi:serine protease [Allokutzneria multivorans]|uniref:Serine protease n=1 Tax=Allokutzneria multivorans TaxID=1142134 RepID=A0ABP7TIN5_9PSEU